MIKDLEHKIETLNKGLSNKNIPEHLKANMRKQKADLESQLAAEISEHERKEKEAAQKQKEAEEKKAAEAAKKRASVRRQLHSTSSGKVSKKIRKKVKQRKIKGAKKLKSRPATGKRKARPFKLKNLPKKVKSFNKGRSASNIRKDKDRRALPIGKRKSHAGWKNQYGTTKGGNTYYERRSNRSDIVPRIRLEKGGVLSSGEHRYLSQMKDGESWLGNVNVEEGIKIPEYLLSLKTARLGERAYDIYGKPIDTNYMRPLFIGKSEYLEYDKIMSDQMKRIRKGEDVRKFGGHIYKRGGNVNPEISAKYNIGWYGNKGAYIHANSGRVLRIFTDKNTPDENWKDAVEWGKNNEGKIRMAKGGSVQEEREFEYLKLSPTKHGLKISLTKEGKEKVSEDGLTRFNFDDYFEGIPGNSEYMYWPDLGEAGLGLTSADGITDGYYYDDDGTLKEGKGSELYYYGDYAIKDFTQELKDNGEVFFHRAEQMAKGGPVSSKQWYKSAVEEKAPNNLGGWKKELPAYKRRMLAIRSRDGKLTRHNKYLSAGRALQALANVTKDEETKKVAEADAKYLFGKVDKMAKGGNVEKGKEKNGYYIYEGHDHYKGKPIYQVVGVENDYVGEWHTNKSDAEDELKSMGSGRSTYKSGGKIFPVNTEVVVNTGGEDQHGKIVERNPYKEGAGASHGRYWEGQDSYLILFDNGTSQYIPAKYIIKKELGSGGGTYKSGGKTEQAYRVFAYDKRTRQEIAMTDPIKKAEAERIANDWIDIMSKAIDEYKFFSDIRIEKTKGTIRDKYKSGGKICPVGMSMQSLLFDRSKFTEQQAKDWAEKEGLKYGKVDTKPNTWRLRQENPFKFKKGSFRNIPLTDGVQAVIACPRNA